jgi:hypothetical protein
VCRSAPRSLPCCAGRYHTPRYHAITSLRSTPDSSIPQSQSAIPALAERCAGSKLFLLDLCALPSVIFLFILRFLFLYFLLSPTPSPYFCYPRFSRTPYASSLQLASLYRIATSPHLQPRQSLAQRIPHRPSRRAPFRVRCRRRRRSTPSRRSPSLRFAHPRRTFQRIRRTPPHPPRSLSRSPRSRHSHPSHHRPAL